MADKKPKERMIKTSIDLTTGQYQFLKIKALERKMRGADPSFVTIIRELIEAGRKKMAVFIIVGFLCIAYSLPADAAYMPFNTNVNLNVGIGTSTPMGALAVMSGNVGIGTWAPVKPFSVIGDAYYKGNIGIGTTFVGGAGEEALTVMNGNVGIGTWAASGALVVMNGNVGIGTVQPKYQFQVASTGAINVLTTNKSTFMEVKYGQGQGSQANYGLTNSFTKVNFHSLLSYTLTDNGGNYSAANDWYVCPVSGTYVVITKIRITDGTTANYSYGQGAGTAAADNPTFLWQQTNTASRNGSQNVMITHYTSGSTVFMFTYSDNAINSSDGDFSIFLLTAD